MYVMLEVSITMCIINKILYMNKVHLIYLVDLFVVNSVSYNAISVSG